VPWPLIYLVAVAFSCLVAHAAGGGARTWAWGFFGPFGWIVAALVGVQARLGEIVVAQRAVEPAPAPETPAPEPRRWPFAKVPCSTCSAEIVVPSESAGASNICESCSKK
jgi:hypothetical protein